MGRGMILVDGQDIQWYGGTGKAFYIYEKKLHDEGLQHVLKI
jgi:hypothetical protein